MSVLEATSARAVGSTADAQEFPADIGGPGTQAGLAVSSVLGGISVFCPHSVIDVRPRRATLQAADIFFCCEEPRLYFPILYLPEAQAEPTFD